VSTLTLVRHGQAHPFQRENGRLTALGEQQAAMLAQFWLRTGVRFDEVYHGTLPRQVRTAEVIAECFAAAGAPWPEPVVDAAWNEYNVRPPQIDNPREFQRAFEAAMTQWLEAAETDGIESWSAFRTRVSTAIQRLMAGPPGRRVAVFTSGGPIGFTAHCALSAPARIFLDLHWRVRNTSITQLLFDRTRLTLDSFNSIAHLDDASLWTYR
jgi:broad specificity phosphatase PhoE